MRYWLNGDQKILWCFDEIYFTSSHTHRVQSGVSFDGGEITLLEMMLEDPKSKLNCEITKG